MRNTFIKTLIELAEQDERIVLLTGDLGFMVMEPFRDKFPTRFYNVGVAEQNMVGIATGLADAGLIPFAYSINTFAAMRPYEFIRNGPVLHQLPVRIVAVGGGFEYGPAGPTHHGLEDIALMRAQPGLTVVAPADYAQTRCALQATWHLDGPVYYRLGKNDKNILPGLEGQFELGRAQLAREGTDVLFVVMGSAAFEAQAAAEELNAQGISAAIAVVASLNPAPVDDLVALLERFNVAITVEAHYINGGVGSLVCEVAAEHGINCRVIRRGVKQSPNGLSGSEKYMHQLHSIDGKSLVATALQALQVTR